MTTLQEKIQNAIDWRIKEISILKTAPLHSDFSEEQKQVLKRHSIPAMYSLWEGFIKDSFDIYIDYLNSLKLGIDEIHPKILTHAVDMKHLKTISTDFEKRIDFVYDFWQYLKSDIVLPKELPTESNINHKVINKILDRFNLQILPEDPFKKQSDKFLSFRNRISHGDFSIPIRQSHIDEYSRLVIELMDELFIRIDDGYQKRTYLKGI